MKAEVIGAVAVMLLAGGAAMGQTHAPWPADWNNWNDPALWVTVGNPGNAPDTRYTPGFGAVSYTYNIGKYEVTARQYTAFLNAKAATDTYGLYNTRMDYDADPGSMSCNIKRDGSPGSYTYSVASDWADRPVNWVTWGNAARFANWLTNGQGNGSTETGAYSLNGAITDAGLMDVVVPDAAQRADWSNGTKPYFLLTSEDEWYKAGYHDKTAELAATYFNYPTNNNTKPSNNLVEPTDPGNNATFAVNDYTIYTIGSPYYRTEVGAHENSDSSYGTFDQGGNVWEWNEAIVEGYRGVRGSSFHGGTLLPFRNFDPPTFADYGVGFRIVQVPEPATLSLLALGGLAMLRRRGKK